MNLNVIYNTLQQKLYNLHGKYVISISTYSHLHVFYLGYFYTAWCMCENVCHS